MIRITCSCGTSYTVPDDQAGTSARCGKCDKLLVFTPESHRSPPRTKSPSRRLNHKRKPPNHTVTLWTAVISLSAGITIVFALNSIPSPFPLGQGPIPTALDSTSAGLPTRDPGEPPAPPTDHPPQSPPQSPPDATSGVDTSTPDPPHDTSGDATSTGTATSTNAAPDATNEDELGVIEEPTERTAGGESVTTEPPTSPGNIPRLEEKVDSLSIPESGLPGETYRKWRSDIGTSVVAILTHVGTDEITLRFETGKTERVEINRLSSADKRYIKLVQRKANTLPYLFAELDRKDVVAIPDYLQHLIDVYRDTETKAETTRLEAFKQLGDYGPLARPALPFLRRLLLQSDLEMRQIVFQTFQNIGKPSVPTLIAILQAMKDPENFATDPALRQFTGNNTLTSLAIQSLAAIGGDAHDAAPVLAELAIMSDQAFRNLPSGRHWAVDATGFDTNALSALRRIDPDPELVVPSLLRLLQTYIPRIQSASRSQRFNRSRIFRHLYEHCTMALEMLDQMPRPSTEIVPSLLVFLQSNHHLGIYRDRVMRTSLNILKSLGPDALEARPLLQSLLQDKTYGKLAEEAIEMINAKGVR